MINHFQILTYGSMSALTLWVRLWDDVTDLVCLSDESLGSNRLSLPVESPVGCFEEKSVSIEIPPPCSECPVSPAALTLLSEQYQTEQVKALATDQWQKDGGSLWGRWFFLKKLPWHGTNPPAPFPAAETTDRGTASSAQMLPPGQAHAWYSPRGSLAERPPGKTLGSLFCSVTAASAPPLKPYFNLPLYVPLPLPLAVHTKHFLKNLDSVPATGPWPHKEECDRYPIPRLLMSSTGWTIEQIVAVQFSHIPRIRQKWMNVPIQIKKVLCYVIE